MDRSLLLLVGQILDAVIGEPDVLWKRVPHPVVIIGKMIERLDGAWNRETETAGTRRAWGAAALGVVMVVAAAVGAAIEGLSARLPFGELLVAVVVGVMLAQRSLHDHVLAVAEGLERGGLAGGRDAVRMIVGRDPNTLDEAGVSRAAIESTAENLSDGVIAPAFWFLVAGLPGLLAYKALNTADSMIGHRTPRHEAFGWAAARLDDVANWPAARLCAGLTVAAAWSVGLDWRAAWHAALRDAGKHRSVNAGWPEAAFAGALGLRLAGPRHYAGSRVDDAWMGDGREVARAADIRLSLRLMVRCCFALAAATALSALI
ncbi:MAG: adenosylcobinamide-phosphate synthase CbiB [Alphaproteobacteria bacterium]|nr:adenosylcobinamide-phosphate synthase CbiB [Alphaproteobacteria bacterium]